MMPLEPVVKKNINMWLSGEIDAETRAKIEELIRVDPKALNEAFYSRLSFGTGGMRGVMGIGTTRMNRYTVGMATQGLANYLAKHHQHNSVFISYDSRHGSRSFAEEAARVLAGNGIQVYLTAEMRPTPLVSFGCRFLRCTAAIMITASHNPREYNGYKVYWDDGGQVVGPHDVGIVEEVAQIDDLRAVKMASTLSHEFITEVGTEIDNAYLESIQKLQLYPQQRGGLNLVYTPLHGTGITLMPEAIKRWGFPPPILVESQARPDGNFPTVKNPNPEDPEALALGIKIFDEQQADLLIATDPDADRVGAVVRHKGQAVFLNGNQIACLLIYHICEALQKRMPRQAAFVKSIGTSELFKEIAESFGGTCFNVLTGFKYIAARIRQWENDPGGYQFIFGAEESYGYLFGTQTRDKDAILSSLLLTEAALLAKKEGKTLIDRLHAIWHRYGMFLEKLLALQFAETQEGREQMTQGMKKLLSDPPKKIAGINVIAIDDYFASMSLSLKTGKKSPLAFPTSDVLLFWLEDGSKLMIRPSGTEPKIKIYCGVKQKQFSSIEEAQHILEERAEKVIEGLKALFEV